MSGQIHVSPANTQRPAALTTNKTGRGQAVPVQPQTAVRLVHLSDPSLWELARFSEEASRLVRWHCSWRSQVVLPCQMRPSIPNGHGRPSSQRRPPWCPPKSCQAVRMRCVRGQSAALPVVQHQTGAEKIFRGAAKQGSLLPLNLEDMGGSGAAITTDASCAEAAMQLTYLSTARRQHQDNKPATARRRGATHERTRLGRPGPPGISAQGRPRP